MISLTNSPDAHDSGTPLRQFTWRGAPILDACTVDATPGALLLLTADGTLWRVDSATVSSTQLCVVDLPVLPVDERQGVFGVPQHRL